MRKKISILLIVILNIIYFSALLTKSDLLGNILSPIITFILFYYMVKGFYLKETNKTRKVAGLLLSLGIFVWFLIDFAWGILNLVFKINQDQFDILLSLYSITNVLILISFIIYGYQELKKWNRLQVFIDTIAISACIMILVWLIFFNQDMQNAILMKNDLFSMISVALDFITFIWIMIWLFSIKKSKMPVWQNYILSGGILFIIIDLIYYYEYFYRYYEPNSLLDGGYVISFMLMANGALVKLKNRNDVITVESGSQRENSKGIYLIMAPFIVILFKGMLVEYLLILVSVIMFYFLFTNYIQKNISRDEMLLEEINLNSMLEKVVKERTQKLQDLVNRDAITGLFSRRYLFERLNLTLSKLNPEENVILFYIDMNRYKMIKTMYGNDIGEKVLTEIGVRLSSFDYNGIELLASYGEDVFILTLRGNYTYDEALQITDKLVNLCSDTYQIEDFNIKVTVNIGVSVYPSDASSVEELIKHANIAMAQARVTGYNQAMTFNNCMGELFLARNKIEIMLKWVNFDNDFLLYYQPQVSSADGKLIGFEALIRWKTKTGEFISPNEFIPIAEKTGAIIPIGYWVMKKAIKQLAEWNSNSIVKPRMAINVSARQLIEKNFIPELKDTMETNHISPEYLEIEITESIQLEENSEIKASLQKINDMGISIAIDDFGTGYSSLYYLKNLPVKRIKIAKPLIDRIDKDTYDYTIVKTVIGIGKIRNIHVIAEGVETKEQWDYLKEMECEEIQGFYFAKPMPPEDIYNNWL